MFLTQKMGGDDKPVGLKESYFWGVGQVQVNSVLMVCHAWSKKELSMNFNALTTLISLRPETCLERISFYYWVAVVKK
jgi:hypothetical protein